ncbi:Ca2+-dependent phosphoinositide-specific phospholipase C [Streptomyces sp. NBC_01387]|uniref:phosphatidylinositol-specific phospholipase C domain-containing protein n=1 Tax=unclassified Streptomyces TaxID=2593676 RepID=UPI0020251EFC|nr:MULTISPECIES: phosphatidylinositol-specific phospholipase C domain-containing protein [unclassified Streptomyces]MCX4552762.1 Ca2+-dependent phosphoinositide-specific phospholipase C [Streptomyces sp. NBC_01500]WSC24100.1 Ca2+-dependent phosphoinositide-specific phospholipase C [Streptomyces sp. NBC_01766]WSV57986.1 Ca2+-dependent phosphoinositide-specific phospholipase C [Streptomyces sp. NBC_01014]
MSGQRFRRLPLRLRAALLGITAAGLALTAAGGTGNAAAAGSDSLPLSGATGSGLHNTYDPATFPYLAQALDTGTSMIELDVWDDIVTKEWKVSHSNPLGNSNNCVNATTPDQLYSGGANKDLESCLDDVRVWLAAHPGHAPLMIKLEMKAGFQNNLGLGPAQLDQAISAHLGSAVFRPADLLAKPDGGEYATLDEAATAGNWPTRAQLAGKVILEVIPGTVEENNPTDSLWTDREYAGYLRDLHAAGRTAQAQVFPAVHNAQAGDPRSRYTDASLRPWFVLFDGDAASYGSIDTAWYDTHHYLLMMTDAQNVAPALDDKNPAEADARARVAQLAKAHASIVSNDWTLLPQVQSSALPRG